MIGLDITGIDKAALLAALFNAATFTGPAPEQFGADFVMSREQAAGIIRNRNPSGWGGRFWKLLGRPIYADIGGDQLYAVTYDRHNGPGTAARVIAELRAATS